MLNEKAFDETELECVYQGIAIRYYKAGIRYQPFIMLNGNFKGLGFFKTLDRAVCARAKYLEDFNECVRPYINSRSLAYFRAVDKGEDMSEYDDEEAET